MIPRIKPFWFIGTGNPCTGKNPKNVENKCNFFVDNVKLNAKYHENNNCVHIFYKNNVVQVFFKKSGKKLQVQKPPWKICPDSGEFSQIPECNLRVRQQKPQILTF